eukprot:5441324-Alexandrium_andersonii.AAC.1
MKQKLRSIACSSNFGISKLLLRATPEFRSWLSKQLRGSASGAPTRPFRRPPGSFGERFRNQSWARA